MLTRSRFLSLSFLLAGIFCAGPAQAQNIASWASANLFNGATINVGSQFDPAFHIAYFTDGTNLPYVFHDGDAQTVSFTSSANDLSFGYVRFFDTPQYAGRTPSSVDIYYSTSTLVGSASVDTSNGAYTLLGSYGLSFTTLTSPGDFSPVGPPLNVDGSPTNQQLHYVTLTGLSMPTGVHSVLMNFSGAPNGEGLSEIQAVPEPATLGLVFGGIAIALAGWRRRARG